MMSAQRRRTRKTALPMAALPLALGLAIPMAASAAVADKAECGRCCWVSGLASEMSLSAATWRGRSIACRSTAASTLAMPRVEKRGQTGTGGTTESLVMKLEGSSFLSRIRMRRGPEALELFSTGQREASSSPHEEVVNQFRDAVGGSVEARDLRVSEVEALALPIMQGFNFRQLSHIFELYGKMRQRPGKEMLAGLEEQLIVKIDTFDSRAISTVLQGYTEMEMLPVRHLVSEITRRSVALMAEFNPPEISKVVAEFKPQDVARTLWAYAALEIKPQPVVVAGMVSALEERAVNVAGDFRAREVANTLWAYATLDLQPGAAMASMLEGRAATVVETFNAQGLAVVLWSYATLGIKPGAWLLARLEDRAISLAADFEPQEIKNLLWAYSKLGVKPGMQLVSGLEMAGRSP